MGGACVVSTAAASTVPVEPDEADTLRTLISEPLDTPTLSVGDQVGELETHTSFAVTYTSGELVISGVLHVPVGSGPFPAVVVVHGFVDRETYTSGSELVREQEALAAAGYVVLATDLRGHAGSDPDPTNGFDLDMGATRDVINGLRSLRVTSEVPIHDTRIGLLGHSLGGLIALNAMVVAPDEMAAVVVVSPSSSIAWNNIEQFVQPGTSIYDLIVGPHGPPTDNPEFWADVSPATFAERSTAPLLIVQGTADDTVDPSWAQETAEIWSEAGAEVQLHTVEGADHVMDPHWDAAMQLILSFLDEELSV